MATFSETDEALMLAYVYGELSASDARAFERRLDAEPDLRAEVEGMKAAHSLFGRDQEWGARTGIDLPPPHLVDAIVRAEQMARVPAVREAMLKKASSTSSSASLTAKLARWLLGGGVLVAGAAALILVVNRSSEAPSLSSTAKQAEAPAAAPVPSPPPPPPAAPEPIGDASASRNAAAADGALSAQKPVDNLRADAKLKDVDMPALDKAEAKRSAAGDDLGGLATSSEASGAKGAGAFAGPRDEKPVSGFAEGEKLAKDNGKLEAKKEALARAKKSADSFERAETKSVKSAAHAARASSLSNEDFGVAGGGAMPAEEPAPPPATTVPMTPMAQPAPKAPAKTAAAPLGNAGAAKHVESASPDVVSDDEIKARREAVMQKRAAKEKAAPQRLDIEHQKRVEAANLAYATGMRELTAKNYPVALDALLSSEQVDIDGALGALPLVGEMKALLGLKRPADAAKIARRIASRDARVEGVVDGWMLGVQIAQQIGDDRLERELWTRLLDVPAHRAEAQAALERMQPRYRAKADRYDSDAAASERAAPAAAAPAPAAESKSKE